MVLIDYPTSKGWVHMVASTKEELHEFAQKIGVKRCWYECGNKKKGRRKKTKRKNRPHYDIKGDQIQKALDAGAKQVNSRELLKFLKNNYEKY